MGRRARGTSAGLDRARIAAAAVALVDRDGLERFGVRRLADELGVDPMSIYHHVKGKAALLDAVSEAVLGEIVTHGSDDGSGDDDWQDVARGLAHAYRDLAYRHPHVVPLLATRAQTSPAAVSALESLVAAMRRAGLPDRVVADAPMVLFGFLNGHLLARTAERPAAVPAFDAQDHPTMSALAPRWDDFGSAAELDRMLDALLAGLAQQASAGTA